MLCAVEVAPVTLFRSDDPGEIVARASAVAESLSAVVRKQGLAVSIQGREHVKVEGWIRDLYVDYTGQAVRKGQPLFTLYSPDLLNTENEYLLALKTRPTSKEMGSLAELWRPWRGAAACVLWSYYRAIKQREGAPVPAAGSDRRSNGR